MAIVDRSSFYLNYSGGNKLLTRVKSLDISDGGSSEMVNAIGSRIPIAFRRKPGGQTLSLEVYDEKLLEVDYYALEASQEQFDFVVQDDDGKRRQFIPCIVSKVDASKNDEGEHMMTIEVLALEAKAL